MKINDLGCPSRSLTTSTVGYSNDSWASCQNCQITGNRTLNTGQVINIHLFEEHNLKESKSKNTSINLKFLSKCNSPRLPVLGPVVDSRGGPPTDRVHLKTGKNFAQKMHYFCIKISKTFWKRGRPPPPTHLPPYSKFLDPPLRRSARSFSKGMWVYSVR